MHNANRSDRAAWLIRSRPATSAPPRGRASWPLHPLGVHAGNVDCRSGAIELAISQREFFGDAQELGDGVFRLSTDPAAGGPG